MEAKDFDKVMLDRQNKRDQLIRLLQKEEMKDAMFKELQIKHGGGFAPTKALAEKTAAAVQTLLDSELQAEEVVLPDAADPACNPVPAERPSSSSRSDRPPSATRPRSASRPPSGLRQRPSSAGSRRSMTPRGRRPASAESSRRERTPVGKAPNFGRVTQERPRSAGSKRRLPYEFSPIRNALEKLYATTAELRPKVRRRPQSAGSIRSNASRPTTGFQGGAKKRPQSAGGTRKATVYTVGQTVEARRNSRTEYAPANVLQINDDGTFDVQFRSKGQKSQSNERYNRIPSVGLQRVKEIVKSKVEQKVRGPSTGKWATVNPHVLKSFFKLFDPSGKGELPRASFAAALREKLGLENISTSDMNLLMDEYDKDGDGNITYEEFSAQVIPNDFEDGHGIIDFPHGNPQGDAEDQLPHLIKQVRKYIEQQKNFREAFRKMGAAGSGELSLYQFKACLRNAHLGNGMDKAVDLLFKHIDKDGSGHINFDEFASELNKDEESAESGNFFIGGGRSAKAAKRRNNVPSIGAKRMEALLKEKLEQKAVGSANGKWAMTNPHILRKFFKEFDEDDSGELDLVEFRTALRFKLGMMNVSDKDIEDLFKVFDKAGKGTISYDEFVEKTMPPEFTFGQGGVMDFPGDVAHSNKSMEEQTHRLKQELKSKLTAATKNMREVFRRFGGSGDGEIDKYEFKAAMRNQHLGIGKDKVMDRLFNEINTSNTGQITFNEFATALNSDENKEAGSFFTGGQAKKKNPGHGLPRIGATAVMEILKDKIEQKVRGRSTGAFATVNPNVLRSTFLSFCTNASGELSHDEFCEAMRLKLGLLNINEKDLRDVAKLFDKDGDGSIDFDEFAAKVIPPEIVNGNGGIMDWEGENGVAYSTPAVQLKELKNKVKKYLAQHKNMRGVFRKMSSGGNGEVTKYEFKACLRNAGVSHGLDKAADILFNEIDKDGSGSINFDEFCSGLNANEEKAENNFFVGGGRAAVGKARVKVPSIGVKRLKEILKDKVEQKCKSRSSGAYARTSAHELEKLFHEFDTSGSGSLSHDEFKEALRTRLGLMNVSDNDLDNLVKEYDKDGDGDVTYEEFIHNVMPPEISHGGGGIMDLPCDDPANQGTAEQKFARLKNDVRKKVTAAANTLRLSFRKMGAAGSGKIGKYEFRTALRNLNLGVGMQDIVDRLFCEIDADGSGSITFQEFAEAMKPESNESEVIISRNLSQELIRPLPGLADNQQVDSKSDHPSRPQVLVKSIIPTRPRAACSAGNKRPATPKDLLQGPGKVAKSTPIPTRPNSAKHSNVSRPYSAGKPGNNTIAVPMQTTRKPRWKGSRGVGRSAPHRMIRRKYESRRRQKGNIIETLKRRYIEEAQRKGVVIPRGGAAHNAKMDLSSLLGVKKL